MKHRFKHQSVSDLAWVMECPSLLADAVSDDWCSRALRNHEPALLALDADPSPLERHLSERGSDQRLGAYFESLVGYWLTALLKMHDVRNRIPLREDGRTIGEHDFLFRDPARSSPIHWEAAVKFYMYEGIFENSSEGSRAFDLTAFRGPNARDSLKAKADRLYQHQLKLAPGHAAEAFVKGILFYPAQADLSRLISEPTVNPRHQRGWWCDQAAFPRLFAGNDSRWVVLPKPLWLGELSKNTLAAMPLLSGEDAATSISRCFNATSRAVMVARFNLDTNKNWIEISRGFIVKG